MSASRVKVFYADGTTSPEVGTRATVRALRRSDVIALVTTYRREDDPDRLGATVWANSERYWYSPATPSPGHGWAKSKAATAEGVLTECPPPADAIVFLAPASMLPDEEYEAIRQAAHAWARERVSG